MADRPQCGTCHFSHQSTRHADFQVDCQRFPTAVVKKVTDWCGEYDEDPSGPVPRGMPTEEPKS